ncbi:TetR/AcrR family transcriptional regulator [Aquabacter cavernae]|uniref:TetR/AcrR family transcriptional regulator n=1 Tax=Aquabacter cavernae TaxID=2496029 RepID=UPI000F8EF23D|nr:TetR/AcrR family transcriptional regulator [Aquabacter cavernae]
MSAQTSSRRETLTSLAIEMMQERGFSALGLRDLAEAAQMRPPSLYNYFASKDDMGRAALALYAERHRAGLEALDALPSGAARIRTYSDKCGECLRVEGRFCLFLMLTTCNHELSDAAVREIAGFVTEQTDWLARAWDAGRADGSIRSDQAGMVMGPILFGALRGMMAFSVLQTDPGGAYDGQEQALLAALGVG